METWDVTAAKAAQWDYCSENGYPIFAPSSGFCPRCRRQIYYPIVYPDGSTAGISVEYARNNLITGCPFCYTSFCD